MVSTTAGRQHLIYPKGYPLAEAADHTGQEHLIAAWLYLHFREQAGGGPSTALTSQYNALTDKLRARLDGSTEPSDSSFMERLLEWRGDSGRRAGETDD